MINIGICGYGNLGRGVELALTNAPDMKLAGIFTRRPPSSIDSENKVYNIGQLNEMNGDIDVLILCGGSATDLTEQSPRFASMYNIVDSYDNHSRIPRHFENVNKSAAQAGTTAVISAGWDPGLFSLQRLFFEAVLPHGETHTFWGKGVSQGHSDAVRRISGVVAAVQYTVPKEEIAEQVRQKKYPKLSPGEKHLRVCFVVSESESQEERIRKEIQTMPDYFAPYETEVHFISLEQFAKEHGDMPHGGLVIRAGKTGTHNHACEFSLKLESNPEFTASILVAYARAAKRLNDMGVFGAKTVFEIPPYLLSAKTLGELNKADL
jgi:diaminopimelate dehydrogenase